MAIKKRDYAKEIEIPEGVSVTYANRSITVKKDKNELSREINIPATLEVKDNKVVVSTNHLTQMKKKMIGTAVAHIKNMIKGVIEGHLYVLKICSGHFPMNVSVKNNMLNIQNFIGEKVPRTLKIKDGVDVKIENDLIKVSSASKELAGQVSAAIEKLTRRPGFDTRIFMDGIYIIEKDGKSVS